MRHVLSLCLILLLPSLTTAENLFLWSNGAPQGMISGSPSGPKFYYGPNGQMGTLLPTGPNSMMVMPLPLPQPHHAPMPTPGPSMLMPPPMPFMGTPHYGSNR